MNKKKIIIFTIVILSFILVCIFIISVIQYTKKSSYLVGFNDGSIDANWKTAYHIVELLDDIPLCSKDQQKENFVLVSVKAEEIYITEKEKNKISLCKTENSFKKIN